MVRSSVLHNTMTSGQVSNMNILNGYLNMPGESSLSDAQVASTIQ